MIIVTGAAGFIGSALVQYLNEQGTTDLLVVDDFSPEAKRPNLAKKQLYQRMERSVFLDWLKEQTGGVELIFHLGARTDTTEQNPAIFAALNIHYSQAIWQWCAQHNVPLVYASSAATYGGGELGYADRHDLVSDLRPLNPYGQSKNDFDAWALQQSQQPPRWYGLKFFNVYGPNEYHKGRMASVIFHTLRQIQATGEMKLFRSHRPGIADGEQQRDFIYVKDVIRICHWLYRNPAPNGLYNVGTGTARTFYDLARLTFEAMDLAPQIDFIDTPADIRDTYQYFTEAEMHKLRTAGYAAPFHSLEEGIQDYVRNYLMDGKYY